MPRIIALAAVLVVMVAGAAGCGGKSAQDEYRDSLEQVNDAKAVEACIGALDTEKCEADFR